MDQKYIDILEDHINNLRRNQDILSTIGELNQKLKKVGYPKRAEDLVTDVFYAIINGKEISMDNRVKFLKVLPTGLKTRHMSDEDILKLIPQAEWKYFRPDSWINKNSRILDETRSIR